MSFDPRLKPKKGQNADDMKRVWDAENVKIAYEAYEQGLPLVASPFITGAPHLRKPGLLYEWSDWELVEAMKCKADVVYFAKTYVQLYRPDGTYGLVEWRPYQLEYLKTLQENRYIAYVASRQIGKTTTTAAWLLWQLIFTPDYKAAVLGDKGATAVENITKLKDMYNRLPFFLKPGIAKWNQGMVAFDNGSSVISGPCTLSTLVGKTLRCLYMDEVAIPEDRVSREVYEFALPTLTNLKDGRLIMSSSPRGAHGVFYETVMKAKLGKSPFKAVETHWYDVPGRDEAWKEEQIQIYGEAGFAQQFDCAFLADENAWLSPETTELLNTAVLNADYQSIDKLTDNEKALKNLAKVEAAIFKSKYVTKSTVKPKRKLVDVARFDASKIASLNDLKSCPILITIDSGEGKLNDHTIAHFWRPELDDDKTKLLNEAYQQELAELEQNASIDADNYDEDSALDAMVDMEDDDELTSEFMLSNGIRCRQIGVVDSNEHSMPMFALFIQLFCIYFLDTEKVKIVPELDGIGSKMQALLVADIINGSGLDNEMFAGNDDKGSPGIYQRGKNKVYNVYDTKQLLEDNRLLPTYGTTVYEIGKFQEIKPGKYAGVEAHDDHTMAVVLAGAYMSSNDFKIWMEDILLPDDEIDIDEDDFYDN